MSGFTQNNRLLCALLGHRMWESWGKWSVCNASCGNGTQVRSRYCSGKTSAIDYTRCDGPHTQIATCFKECPGKTKFCIFPFFEIDMFE